jgi:hypothetical protein
MATHYAAIDSSNVTGAVYGIGSTPEEAIRDASREVGVDASDLAAVPLTDGAREHIEEHGGGPSPVLSVSLRGVTLRSEEP